MEPLLIGRKKEQELLRKCYESNNPEFVVVYGRRRVGKTYLVQQTFNNNFDFHLTGIYKKGKKYQLQNFANTLSTYSGQNLEIPHSWGEAFMQLRKYIETINKDNVLIFIDELPWLDTAKGDLVASLESFWNGWGSAQKKLKLIVCGSATSWIANKIFQNKGGLFNRDTMRIHLHPFTLKETEQFCGSRNLMFTQYDIAQCHMIMGGIPYYLNKIEKGLSLAQNIDQLFFKRGCLLENEFYFLYNSLFSKPDNYIKVVELLAQRKHGYTMSEISSHIKMPIGGNLSKIIKDLESCDIITSMLVHGANRKETTYLLCDFYTLFYQQFIRDNNSGDMHYWETRQNSGETNAWRGHAFELLCLTHIEQIRAKLGISGVAINVSAFDKKGTKEEKGAQIDLIIERQDNITNVCEIKFNEKEYEIKKSYSETLQHKLEVYKKYAPKKQSLFLTMITAFGLKQNNYAGMVQNQLSLVDLFV